MAVNAPHSRLPDFVADQAAGNLAFSVRRSRFFAPRPGGARISLLEMIPGVSFWLETDS